MMNFEKGGIILHRCAVCKRTEDDCQVHFCSSYGDYLCSKHKNQWRRHGRFTDLDVHICEICGATSRERKIHWCSAANKYLCLKHRSQFNRIGGFLTKEQERKTYNSENAKNEYLITNTCAYIIFRNRKGFIKFKCPIDKEDIERLSLYKWEVTTFHGNSRYVREVKDHKVLFLHRFLLNPEPGEIIDHINRNGLDNRKSNLRIVSPSENSANSKTRSITGEKNIYIHSGAYRVEIIRDYKRVFVKTCKTLEDAVKSRDEFLERYNKEHNRVV